MKKRSAIVLIEDTVLKRRKKHLNFVFIMSLVLLAVPFLYYSWSLFYYILSVICLNLLVSFLKERYFTNSIEIFFNHVQYKYKGQQTLLEIESIAFIDQGVAELGSIPFYQYLKFLNEDYEEILNIDSKNFNYEELVELCLYIQEHNQKHLDFEQEKQRRLLNSAIAIDEQNTIEVPYENISRS